MLTRRKLTIAAVTLASMGAILGLAALPEASADGCTVVITVAGGQTFTFENVAPGTDPSSLPLPGEPADRQRLAVVPAGHRDHAGRHGHCDDAADDPNLNLDFNLDDSQAEAVVGIVLDADHVDHHQEVLAHERVQGSGSGQRPGSKGRVRATARSPHRSTSAPPRPATT